MFSKKPAPILSRTTSKSMAASGATFSVIGPDVTIRGDIEASADLHVDGVVLGDLTCSSLVQGEASRIEGSITAERARLSGQIKGTITARELVVLKSARIEGDVAYETLTIEQGATVNGRFAPKGAAVASSTGAEELRLSLAG
jgi:cytoskeletal protein CcmA (bactofilin family)